MEDRHFPICGGPKEPGEKVCSLVCAGKKSWRERVYKANRVSPWEVVVLGLFALVLGAAAWFGLRGRF